MKASIHIARGWAAALKMVEAALDEILGGDLTPDQKNFRAALYDLLNEWTPDEHDLKRKPTNRELAAQYAVCPRTIVNWRKAGCPFEDGQWKVLNWVADQRIIPAGVRTKFARQLERRRRDSDDLAALKERTKSLLRAVGNAKDNGLW